FADGDNYNELFGALDNAFLVAYAIGMFISGIFGERLPLRYHLSAGMVLSGLFTALFGLVSFWNIHVLWYFIIMQVCNGLVQTTGWPSVVACVGNWFGKGKRGFIMGIWNSHTSVGNILGSLVAGVWVSSAWGFSFVVPGIVIAIMGIISFFFLVEYPEDVGCNPPMHHMASDEEDVGGVASKEKDPEAVTSHEGPLKVSGQSSGDHSNSPKEPAEEPEAISFLGALRIPGVVEFSLCLLFAKLVSYTFLYWLPLYIVNVAHFGAKEAGDLSTLFDVGGILGGIFAGLVSDYTGGRATTCCVMLVVAAPMLFLYNHVGQKGIGTSVVMLIVCGALVNGPYALITTAVSADLGTHECLKGNAKALSTVTAIIDGTGSVGAALGPLLAGLISPTGWNNVFYMLIAADVLACLMASDEEDVGGVASKEKDPEAVTSHEGPLKVSGQSSGDHSNSPKEPAEEPEAISFLGALRIPGVVEFSLCLLFAKLVSYTFLYWLPLYIVNVAHFGAKEAGDLSTLFDVGGILGGIFAGLVSDYTGGRATTCCVMLVVAAPMLFLYNHVGQKGIGTSVVMLIVCGALVNGPYALITTAVSADLGTHECLKGNAKALSTVTAIIDGTGSVGAALGPLLAGLISPTGWNNVFYMLIAADVLACLMASDEEDVGGVASKEKDPEAVTSHEGPLKVSGQSSGDHSNSPKEPAEEPEAISFLGALRIPGVVEFSLCLLFAKLVSYTFLYWLPLYIVNVAHFGAKEAGDLSTLFDVGGILGGIFAGLVSDYTGGRATTCCVMLVVAAPMLFLYNHVGQKGIGTSVVMLIVCGALVNGPYALITTAVSADLGTHECLKGNAKALSTVTAIIDGTGSVGAALGPLLAGLISPTGWNNVFYMLIAADVLACLMASDEEDVGGVASKEKDPEAVTSHEGPLKVSGQSSGDHSNSPKEPAEEPEAISFLGALRIPGVVEFSLCLLFAKLVSYTFLYWLPLYIVNVAHFGAKEAGDLSTLFDVGGILGGIFAGLVSDYTGGRATTCCVMLVVAAPMLFLYNHVGQKGIGTSVVMLIVCGALVNGPYALITTAVSADLGTHECLKGNAKALSTVTAIIDGTGSVGAALGPLLAGLISPTGWNNVFYMLIAADVLACLMASDEEDVGGVASKEKDPEAVTSHEGPLKVSGQSSGDHSNSPKEPAEEPEAISFLGALRIPGVVEFSLCLLFAKLVSYTFLYWLPLYIVNVAHFGAKEAGDLSTLFDVGGIL
ncbi:uncharacterized protein, partial [Phaenicophaeus curvirostris]|uniref:uncharacterized protein n=1 Tax=Phaenicophaeus curvirostris TaxID=33595 RepID=UPI0037F0A800